MPHYIAQPKTCAAMPIYQLADIAHRCGSGPTPKLRCGRLVRDVRVGVEQYEVIDFARENADGSFACYAFGLITCAALVLVWLQGGRPERAIVHHANAGELSDEKLRYFRDLLRSPPMDQVYAVYAISQSIDEGYISCISCLKKAGIPDEKIIVIDKLLYSNFGIDGLGFVGCR